MGKSDSILGCAALLRDAEMRAARCFTLWTEANNRFRELLNTPDDEPTSSGGLETAWIRATASYEAMLDAQRDKHALRIKLKRLKASDALKRSSKPIAIPIRRLSSPISYTSSLDPVTDHYCRLRAQGHSPTTAASMAGISISLTALEADEAVKARIRVLRGRPEEEA